MLGKWYKHAYKKDVFVFAAYFYSVNGVGSFRFVPEIEGIEFHPLLKQKLRDDYKYVPFEQIEENRIKEVIKTIFEQPKRFDFAYMRNILGL